MIQCKFCNHKNTNTYPNKGRECPICGSIFIEKNPTPQELQIFYEDFNKRYNGGGRSTDTNRRQTEYAEAYLKLVNRFTDNAGHLVDIGSSTNPFPNLARKYGFDVTVLDFIRPETLDPEIKFVAGPVDADTPNSHLEIPNSYADVTTNFAVIEHCLSPENAVAEMARMTKPGGHIILTTPFVDQKTVGSSVGYTRWFCPPEHLNLISPTAMDRLFQRYSCTNVTHRYFELTVLRYIARYGILHFEGLFGSLLKRVSYNYWKVLRHSRKSFGQGILCSVYKRNI